MADSTIRRTLKYTAATIAGIGSGLLLSVAVDYATAFVHASADDGGAQAAAHARTFASDAGMILNFVKPDKTAEFENVMAKLKEARAPLRERITSFLTPDQLSKWDAEVAKAKSFLGYSS